MKKIKRALIVVAHTDDESFGCGAFIKKLYRAGVKIYAMSFTNGVGSRQGVGDGEIKKRLQSSKKAAKILGFNWIKNLNYPDNKLDQIPLLNLVKEIENIKNKIDPRLVLTHSYTDLNVDHKKIFDATITAFRPEATNKDMEILTFEIPSSTDFYMLKNKSNFIPNYFVNIDKYIQYKIKAVKCYKRELKKSPNSRSINGIKNLAKIRGNQSGLNNAEAFEIVRKIKN